MYYVDIKNMCRCALRNAMADSKSFDTKDDAKDEAEKILKKMNEEFCKKHRFVLKESFGSYTITILAN